MFAQKASEYTERFRRILPGLVEDLFWREWSPSAAKTCKCGQHTATLRCDDCCDDNCLCDSCMNRCHMRTPFHRVRRWNGRFFQREPPKAEISLGHTGNQCPSPRAAVKVEVVHTTGTFSTTVHPCGCDAAGRGEQRILPRQFMRHGLFPGSFDTSQVHWAFTFAYLDHWLATSHHAKISVMDYWATSWFLTTGLPAERVSLSV